MSEHVSHTPGPWQPGAKTVCPKSRKWAQTDVLSGPKVVAICAVTKQTVSEDDVAEDDVAEIEANARLIAAAPELLAALIEAERMLLVAMGRDLVFDDETQREIIAKHSGMKQIRDAIAKAKGA